MAGAPLGTVLRYARQAAASGGAGDLPDAELLRRFAAGQDQAAFAGLVRRHGGLVWSVCRNLLRNEQDAEDAFQAAFVVLARKAASIRKGEAVGSWLHGVAYRVAMRAKRDAAVRRAHERRGRGGAPGGAPPGADLREALALVDEEVGRLPESCRAAFVLCCLEGKGVPEAARRLGRSEGAVAVALTRARKRLRERLARRGVTLAAALSVSALARHAAAAPAVLLRSTIEAATRVAAGRAAAGVLSGRVAALSEGVMKTMIRTKLRLAAVLLAALGAFGVGAGALAGRGQAVEGAAPGKAAADKPPARAGEGAKDPTPAAPAILKEALEAAGALKDPGLKARALLLIAQEQTRAGDKAAAVETLRAALQAAGAMPADSYANVNDRWGVQSMIAGAQADAGDVDAARKTVEAIRKPGAEVEGIKEGSEESGRCHARRLIAAAQARAGKFDEAAATAALIGGEFGYMKGDALVEVAAARADAGDWKEAREAVKAIPQETYRVRALTAVARAQARAGQADEARKSIDDALRVVGDLLKDRQGEEDRAECLRYVATAQADLGDAKAALLTAESIPDITEKTITGEVITFPFKERTLVELKARAGDFKGAKEVALTIDDDYQGGYQKGYAGQVIARSQAAAKEVEAARETAGAIAHAWSKAGAFVDIAREQARAGDVAGAAKTFGEALPLARAVPDGTSLAGSRAAALRLLAAAQAEAGEDKAAREWVAKEESPYLKAAALVGLAEGGAKRREAEKRPKGEE